MKTKTNLSPLFFMFLILLGSTYGANSNAVVYVIHGIAGQDLGLDSSLPVDVSVEGGCTLEGFTYGQAAGPLELSEGTYNIKISLANPDAPCSNAPVIEADVPFSSGEVAVVVAHLTADKQPTASKFLLKHCQPWRFLDHQSDVYLHHTAGAPSVDIKLNRPSAVGLKTIKDVTNGNQAVATLAPGDWAVSLLPAGAVDPVLGPVHLNVSSGKDYIIFASGSLDEGSLTLLIYTRDPKCGPLELLAASVYVIHGIPGQDLGLAPALPVDISLNGQCALQGFTFGEITDELSLIPGVYNVKIALANPDTPCSESAVIDTDVPLHPGDSVTIIAHLTQAGAITASVFENDLRKELAFLSSPLVVHHTAAAPAVDVSARRWRRGLTLEDVNNGDQGLIQLRPGRWNVSILPSGSDDPVLGPLTLNLRQRYAYYLYAVGSLDSGTLTVLQNVIPLK